MTESTEVQIQILMKLSEKTGRKMRIKDFRAKTVFIKIRYDNFDTYTRQNTLQQSFADSKIIYKKPSFLYIF